VLNANPAVPSGSKRLRRDGAAYRLDGRCNRGGTRVGTEADLLRAHEAQVGQTDEAQQLPQYRIPEFGLYVVRPPPATHMPRKIRVLTELMVEKFGGEPYRDACYQHRKRR
jgi:hypothetical protein